MKYLTVNQLCDKIGYAKQSIYNMISAGVFIKKIHYIKPSRKKILFIWAEVEKWMLEGSSLNEASNIDSKSKINI